LDQFIAALVLAAGELMVELLAQIGW